MQVHINKGFTMMEIMTVVIIVGIISVFAIPNFNKTMDRSYAQDAATQLTALHSALEIYKVQTGSYWPTSGTQTLAAINSTLGLSIMANNLTYQCTGNGTTYSCTATHTAFVVTVTDAPLSSTNPECTGSC